MEIGMKIDFSFPRRTKLVYIGRTGLGILQNYIAERDFVVFENPRSRLNVWVMLRMLITRSRSQFAYFRAYLLLYRPEIVITMEDNYLDIFSTKLILPKCTTIVVQNGLRNDLAHSAGAAFREKLRCHSRYGYDADVIVTHGGLGESYFKSAITESRGTFVKAGSLMNNAISLEGVDVHERPRRLVFISKYPKSDRADSTSDWNTKIHAYMHGTPLTTSKYFEIDAMVSRICGLLAQEMSLAFVVLGKRPERLRGEYQFFAECLKGVAWTYLPSNYQTSSYASLKSGDVVVNVDSTLGYELFCRGFRTAFISARLDAAGCPQYRDYEFGHPIVTDSCGPFWTNRAMESEIRRVLQFVVQSTKAEWLEQSQVVRSSLYTFDPGNTIFCRVLESVGVKTHGPRSLARELISAN